MKFKMKAVLYYTVSVIVGLTICSGLNVMVYCFLDYIGIPDFGRSVGFMLGMAVMGTSFFRLVVSLLSEDILFSDDKEEDEDEEIDCEDVFGEL